MAAEVVKVDGSGVAIVAARPGRRPVDRVQAR